MLAMKIVNPAKVERSALQNAASIAAMVLTTEALVADKPEEKRGSDARRRTRRRHGRYGLRHVMPHPSADAPTRPRGNSGPR